MSIRVSVVVALFLSIMAAGCTPMSKRWNEITQRLGTTSRLSVYRGIPHPRFDPSGHESALAGNTKSVPGGLASAEPLAVSPQQQEELLQTLCEIGTVSRYNGDYKDGGFWPEYAIRCQTEHGEVVLSKYGRVYFIEDLGGRLKIICDDARADAKISAILESLSAEHTQALIDRVYGEKRTSP